MANDIFELIQRALKLSHLEVRLESHWGSQNPSHRKELHSQSSNLQMGSHSISHCPDIGGFAHTNDSGVQIGFDIELNARLEPRLAERVSHPQESYQEASSPAIFWCAKEASYKALRGPLQPKVISEIRLGNWTKWSSQIETFQILSIESRLKTVGLGAAARIKDHSIAIFTFRA